jgi:mRNA interferase MazF
LILRIEAGGLYAADLNPRHGTEPGKVRPVVVVQTDLLNGVGHPSTVVLPCTTQLTGESILRVHLPQGVAGNDTDCEVIVDQCRALDNRRLRRQLGRLPKIVMTELQEKLRHLLDL